MNYELFGFCLTMLVGGAGLLYGFAYRRGLKIGRAVTESAAKIEIESLKDALHHAHGGDIVAFRLVTGLLCAKCGHMIDGSRPSPCATHFDPH